MTTNLLSAASSAAALSVAGHAQTPQGLAQPGEPTSARPGMGRCGAAILGLVRAGIATVLAFAACLIVSLRRSHRSAAANQL